MLTSKRMRRGGRRLCAAMLTLALGACASSAGAGSGGAAEPGTGGAFFGAVAPSTVQQLVARATLPARIGGEPTALAAEHALAAPGWPVASANTAAGSLVSRWLAFKQGTSSCWIRMRLLVLPLPQTPDSVQLGAQLWLQERLGSGSATEFARKVLVAFRNDVVSDTMASHGARRQLGALVNYTDPTADYVVCGTWQERARGE